MNLQKLLETQKILDDRIIEQHGLEGQDFLPEKILALQVELGELANEWRGFKFWSEDQEPRTYAPNVKDECKDCQSKGYKNKFADIKEWIFCESCDGCGYHFQNPLLEEYVDCLHFILGIGLQNPKFRSIVLRFDFSKGFSKEDTITAQFNRLFNKVGDFSEYKTSGNYFFVFEIFAGLGEMLGFSWEQIEQAYYDKNKINHTRQATGY